PLPSQWTAAVDWGDASVSSTVSGIADPVTAGLFDVVGTHTFAEEGTFRLTVNVTDVVNSVSATSSFVSQTNLVTDDQAVLAGLGFAPAAHIDTNLVNPWGVSFSPTGPVWVSVHD